MQEIESFAQYMRQEKKSELVSVSLVVDDDSSIPSHKKPSNRLYFATATICHLGDWDIRFSLTSTYWNSL